MLIPLNFGSGGHINEDIDRINDSLDIVDLIRNSPKALSFAGSGDRYTAHTNSNSQSGASLIITPREQKWHDKATGEGGLAFNWIAYELLGTSRPRGKDVFDVLKVAAEKAGITLSNYSEEHKALFQEKEEIISLFEQVNEIWVNNLQNEPEILEDLRKRHGLTAEQAKEHGIGYAIGSEDLKGFDKELLAKSGLVYPKGGNAFFQHRITYPYFKNGRPVYFIGRLTKHTPEWENQNKYKKLQTYNEKHLYVSKTVQNSTIYGQDTVRGKDYFVITEGIGDCLALHCAGIPAISPITTTFPTHDIPKLLDLAKGKDRVYIVNDSEESGAGEKGAFVTAKILEEAGITAIIVIIPRPEGVEKIDVAEFMRDNSAEDFIKLLASENAFGMWNYILNKKHIPKNTGSIEKKRAFQSFIENDLSGMKQAEWELFVTNEVRKKFGFLKDEIKTVMKDVSDRRNKAVESNSMEEKGDRNETSDPLESFPEWAINQANQILNCGDAFQFILDTWQKKHVGDTNISENCLCSVITSRILNSKRGLHIKPSGESGKGKSSSIEDFLKLLPDGSYITGSMSAKALFYDKDLKPGTIVYSDDASFSEEVIATIKQSTSKFQEPTFHRTVINGEFKSYPIPERVTFWFSAVEGMDDDQLANRFLHADVDPSREQDKRVNQYQKDSETWYESDIIEPDVLVCRCIFTILFSELYRVKIPFIQAITWNNPENRRNFEKFTDIIRAVTVYNCRKRECFDGFLMATTEDFERALRIYKGTSVNNATNLTDTELKYLRYILNAPNKTVTVKMLVKHFDVSDTAVRNMLNGRRGNGGLLAKVKQLIVIDNSKTVKTDTTSDTTKEKFYQYVGEFTGLDLYESIASLDYSEVERVTQQFKETLHENMSRVTQGNIEGNLSKVTLENGNSIHNNIINNNKVTINMENESDEILPPPTGDVNNSDFEEIHQFSQVTPSEAKQGYPQDEKGQTMTKTRVTKVGLGGLPQGCPQRENDTQTETDDIHDQGYPQIDDTNNQGYLCDLATDESCSSLLRKALKNYAWSEFNGVIENIPVFVGKFNERTPEFKQRLGLQAVLYNAERLSYRGWK